MTSSPLCMRPVCPSREAGGCFELWGAATYQVSNITLSSPRLVPSCYPWVDKSTVSCRKPSELLRPPSPSPTHPNPNQSAWSHPLWASQSDPRGRRAIGVGRSVRRAERRGWGLGARLVWFWGEEAARKRCVTLVVWGCLEGAGLSLFGRRRCCRGLRRR